MSDETPQGLLIMPVRIQVLQLQIFCCPLLFLVISRLGLPALRVCQWNGAVPLVSFTLLHGQVLSKL